MVIISVIKNHQTKQKGNRKIHQVKTNHEFNNFATHYHMLISKHHTRKQTNQFFFYSLLKRLSATWAGQTNLILSIKLLH